MTTNHQTRFIAFTGGGTAGHVIPNIALMENQTPLGQYIQQNKVKVLYLASRHTIERDFLKRHGLSIQYFGIWTGKLRRYWHWRNLTDPFLVLLGFFQSVWILWRYKPIFVFSKGGFCAVPVVWAAWLLRIPIWVHESDSSVSLSTKLTAPLASRIFWTFPHTLGASRWKIGETIGLPIRLSLQQFPKSEPLWPASHKSTILVMGGSLGSRKLNQFIEHHLDIFLREYNVIHIRGYENTNHPYKNVPGYYPLSYTREMGPLFHQADILWGRAGANTIMEALAFGLPLLLTPLPLAQSRGDQILNAQRIAEIAPTYIIPEDLLDIDQVLEALVELRKHPKKVILDGFKTTVSLSKQMVEMIEHAL